MTGMSTAPIATDTIHVGGRTVRIVVPRWVGPHPIPECPLVLAVKEKMQDARRRWDATLRLSFGSWLFKRKQRGLSYIQVETSRSKGLQLEIWELESEYADALAECERLHGHWEFP